MAKKQETKRSGLEVAVIGMAGRFPGAVDVDEFWENLRQGKESISYFSQEELREAGIKDELLNDPNYVKARGFVKDKDRFDHQFFDYIAADAELMDPQIRVLHECAWHALEHAGYDPGSFNGPIGLYAGATRLTDWELRALLGETARSHGQFALSQLTNKDFIVSWISYKLNLKGPAVLVHSACSTSLLAAHMASRALVTGECDMALAGGVTLDLAEKTGYLYSEGLILSPDGHCRPFDAEAGGTVGGEGVGLVALKRLKDAVAQRDTIYAVIKSSAANNDGLRKAGFSAPSVEGQVEVIKKALRLARVEAESIGYIEAHGTGTILGDPIEIKALTLAFKTEKRQYCAVGSVKSNVGHLDSAAGVAGLIKAILSLHHKQIPASLNFQSPNPDIDFDRSPFFVNTALRDWPEDLAPARVGVNSFGIGGTNVHVVLEEAPPMPQLEESQRKDKLFLISAHTADALEQSIQTLAHHVQTDPSVNLADAAYTLQKGRKYFQHRAITVADSVEVLQQALDTGQGLQVSSSKPQQPDVVFLFPGQGAQYAGMGRHLYKTEAVFREGLDHCFAILKPLLGRDPQEIMGDPSINQTEFAQPLILSIEYALARLLMYWGIEPIAMMGHSIGEYTAAILSGVMTLEQGLQLTAYRGKLMQQLPEGAMIGVQLPEEEAGNYLDGRISMAAVNGPRQCVLSGEILAIEEVARKLENAHVPVRRLHTSHAFHSHMMDPAIRKFAAKISEQQFKRPEIPYISNVTGTWISYEELTAPDYWTRHLRESVRFSDGIGQLLTASPRPLVFVEVGPGRALSTFVSSHLESTDRRHMAVNLMRHPRQETTDQRFLLEQLGRMWLGGITPDWENFYAGEKRTRVPLPVLPFTRRRFPIDTDIMAMISKRFGGLLGSEPTSDRSQWYYSPEWQRIPRPNRISAVETEARQVLVFSDGSAFSNEVADDLKQRGHTVAVVTAAAGFAQTGPEAFTVDPSDEDSYIALFEALDRNGALPRRVIHLWNVGAGQEPPLTETTIDSALDRGFFSLIYMARALGNLAASEPVDIAMVSSGVHAVTGNEILSPDRATVLGAVKIVPLEYPNVACRSIDIDQYQSQQLAVEIWNPEGEQVTAIRGGFCWRQVFGAVPLEAPTPKPATLKPNGVYLITGGLGGMGLTIAQELTSRYQAKLILTGRSANAAPNDFGPDVMVTAADVSNLQDMERVIKLARERFGHINGVFHAAGVGDYHGAMQLRSIASIREVLAPKIHGALILSQVLADDPPELTVLFSSIGNVLHGVKFGQVAYNGANEFLDGYAQYLNARQGATAIAINWNDWVEKGMSVDAARRRGEEIDANWKRLALSPSEGADAFLRIVEHCYPRIVVSRNDLNHMIRLVNTPVEQKIEQLEAQPETADFSPRPDLTTVYAPPQTPIQHKLAAIWQRFFGIDEIGIHDDFFELGGDSLKAMTIIARVKQEINLQLGLGEFFKKPTIKGVALYLQEPETEAPSPLIPVEERDHYPVSSAQRRLFILQQMEPGGVAYNSPQMFVILGPLDLRRLRDAFSQLVSRHEGLRTTFPVMGETPVQRIRRDMTIDVELKDQKPDPTELVRPFDLAEGPLLRIYLYIENPHTHWLMIDRHHIISDGFSTTIFIGELTALYHGRTLPPLTMQYRDYSAWLGSQGQQEILAEQREFWLDRLTGPLPVLELPLDFQRPAIQSFAGKRNDFTMGEEMAAALQRLATQQEVTLYTLLLAMIYAWLYRLSGQEDIIVGSPVAARRHADLQGIIGMFVNTLAHRNFPSGDQPFITFLEAINQRTLEALENQEYPFEDLVEAVTPQRDPSRNPIFDVAFTLQNLELENQRNTDAASELNIELQEFDTSIAKFDLSIICVQEKGTLSWQFEYCTALFAPDTIDRFIDYFKNIASEILDNPQLPLSEFPMISPEEREELVFAFNDTAAPYPQDCTIYQLFRRQVRTHPHTVAVADPSVQVTFDCLDRHCAALSNELLRRGLEKEEAVAVLSRRSASVIAGLLAILKAGGAYLPLDTDYPLNRQLYMLRDSSARFLLSRGETGYEGIEDIDFSWNGEPPAAEEPESEAGAGTLAYIIYTSGSTGNPKGVMVEQRNVTRLVMNTNYVAFGPEHRILQTGALEFDASTFEIWGSLLNGQTLVLVHQDNILSPHLLKETIRRFAVTTMWMTAPLFNRMVQEDVEIFSGLRQFLVGGDALSPPHINKLRQAHPALAIINGYGPTENTTFSTTYTIEDEFHHSIPIGTPIANSTAYILSPSLEPQPKGVRGELYVGGDGVARGYLNDPELTAQRFVDSPFEERLYKTGDMARFRCDGNIDFLGRIDFQVKIRGFRIELGEIEGRLLAHHDIADTVVLALDQEGEKQLCAYYVSGAELETGELRSHLSGYVPDYMIPSYFMKLEHIPLTANGKVDRRALPAPELGANQIAFEAPRGSLEQRLAKIWAGVLGLEPGTVSRDADFFQLGGHSLKATVLMGRVHKLLQVKIPLVELFQHPTLRELAQLIASRAPSRFQPVPALEKQNYYPLSSAQKRLFVLQQMDPANTVYNIPQIVQLDRDLAIDTLRDCFRQLALRHESLRTAFIDVDGAPAQRILDGVEIPVHHLDLTDAPERDAIQKAATWIREFIQPFDLAKPPLARAAVISLPSAGRLLMLDLHHIISDGTSMGVLMDDMAVLMNGGELPPLHLHYKDYAAWQRQNLSSGYGNELEEYWLEQFSGPIPVLELPTDFPRPPVQSLQGEVYTFGFNPDETGAINDMAAKKEATLYMLLAAALVTLLWRLSGQEDIVLGTAVSGRRHPDLERIVGMFVNTLALRATVPGGQSFSAFLRMFKSTVLKDFEHQDYPFEELVDKVAAFRDSARNPLFDVLFTLQNMAPAAHALGSDVEDDAIRQALDNRVSRFDMTWMAWETEDRLEVAVEFDCKLFKQQTVARFASYFKNILTAAARDSELRLHQIELLPAEEQQTLLYTFNDTATEYPRDASIYHLFRQQTNTSPDAVAVVDPFVQVTYRCLDRHCGLLAGQLAANGLRQEEAVAVLSQRSAAVIAGLLGILKAGGAYLPLNTDYPLNRQLYMLRDSSVRFLLTEQPDARFDGILDMDIAWKGGSTDAAPMAGGGGAGDLAYIIYTSGSTGNPKGVMVEQRNVTRLVKNTNYVVFGPEHRILQTGALEFDASTFEIWGSLLNGQTLFLIHQDNILSPHLLKETIRRLAITTMWMTAPLFNRLVLEDTEIFKGLRQFLVGGDALSPPHIKMLREAHTELEVINGYGPTENTTFSTTYAIEGDISGSIPIGSPIANSTAYVLSSWRDLQPIGVSGELYVGGDGVARGYLNDPELTVERFVSSPYEERLYKTGDMASLREDGTVDFLGRIDFQVKIRGFRIELGEIEGRLLAHPAVIDAVVTALEADGEKYLCAYVVSEKELDMDDLRNHLSGNIPEYMIPSYFTRLERIPLTTNGKVDREALPKPQSPQAAETYEAPSGPVEIQMSAIWAQVLGIDAADIGRNSDFFQLGGHSLKATVLMARIHKHMGIKAPLVELFQYPTLREFSAFIATRSTAGYHAVPGIEKREYYPLSAAQKRLYVLQQMDDESIVYNMPLVLSLPEAVSIEELRAAADKLVARHESLRTYFTVVEGQPKQRLLDSVAIEPVLMDQADIQTAIQAFPQPFDLTKAPLFRMGLIPLEEGESLLLLDMHHIIGDGASMAVLMRECSALLKGEALKPLDIQYKEFAMWQQSPPRQQRLELHRRYWLQEYADGAPVLELPLDFQRPAVQQFQGDTVEFSLTAETAAQLRELAIGSGGTLFVCLSACYFLLLHKLSGQEEIVVGTAVAGRNKDQLQDIVGMFVNTLAIRRRIDLCQSFPAFVQELKTTIFKAFDHQDYQFEDLVEQVVKQRDPGRNPLFDTMFTLQNLEGLDTGRRSRYSYQKNVSRFDMTWIAEEVDNRLLVSIEFDTHLFRRDTICRFVQYYKTLLSNLLLEDERLPLAQISLVSEDERRTILHRFNDSHTPVPSDRTIDRLFEEAVEAFPHRTAIVDGDGNSLVTYEMLDRCANHLASRLRRAGVGPDSIVGLLAERGLGMIISIMGILKAGGAYLPLDTHFPQQRMRYMLNDGGCGILLANRKYETLAPEGVDTWAIEDCCFDATPATAPTKHHGPANLCYVIFTSGTTGKPKGNLTQHSNVIRVARRTNYIHIHEQDRLLQLSNYAFDGSVFDIYGALLNGAVLVLLEAEEAKAADRVAAIIRSRAVTMFFVTTALFNILVDYELESLAHVRRLLFGGERVSVPHTRKALEYMGKGRVVHVYGPTETTVYATHYPIKKIEDRCLTIPIGAPIANTDTYILDQWGEVCPIGVTGELLIGGQGVARGYLNNPALTHDKFIPNPFVSGDRLYRSGDLARFLPSGDIQFLGRKDQQVKIRGFRIELGEIETLLRDMEGVKEALVIDWEPAPGEKQLAAYLVLRYPQPVEQEFVQFTTQLRAQLADHIPEFMIPTSFVPLPHIPLTPNGKVDRRALPKPRALQTAAIVPPQNTIQQTLRTIWAALLAKEEEDISMTDDFFVSGGHSLKATVLAAKIQKEFSVKIPLAEIFKNPCINGIADYIEQAGVTPFAPVEPAEERDYHPLTSAQRRLYVLQQLDFQSTVYNMPFVFDTGGRFSGEEMERAFGILVRRHEIFRTSFISVDGRPAQRIEPTVDFQLRRLQTDDPAAAIQSLVRPFDLAVPPLIRAALVESDGGGSRLLVDMHHIAGDGFSIWILKREFEALLGGHLLPVPKLQYKDFAHWQQTEDFQQGVKRQKEFWINEYAGDIPVLELPADFPRPEIQSFKGASLGFSLDPETCKVLRSVARRHEATLFMVLFSAFAVALHKICGQEELAIGTPVSGRQHPDTLEMIGMFVNTLALRFSIDSRGSFGDLLLATRRKVLAAFDNQDYPFEELVEAVGATRDAGRNPLFDVMFTLQHAGKPGLLSGQVMETAVSRFDLTLGGTESDRGIDFTLEYCVAIFKEETMRRWIDYFIRVTAQMAEHPDSPLAAVEIVSPQEKATIISRFNDTEQQLPSYDSILTPFFQAVQKRPQAQALVWPGHSLSYRVLRDRIVHLARHLRAEGVGPETLAAVKIPRSADMVIAIFGVLAAGGAYLALDMNAPEERLRYIQADSGARAVVDRQMMDVVFKDYSGGGAEDFELSTIPTNPAYVIYTSGSTGRPKGSLLEHRSAVNLLGMVQRLYPIDGGAILLKTNVAFDVSVPELFCWYWGEGRLAILKHGDEKDPAAILQAIRDFEVTHVDFVPSMLDVFLDTLDHEEVQQLAGLRYVLVGGEAFSKELAAKIRRLPPHIMVENMYGPSEAAVYTSNYTVTGHPDDQPVPIGKPMDNIQCFVLDKDGALRPPLLPGELCVGGAGLGRGYLNRPELTAEKYIQWTREANAFPGGKRLYKTGDLALFFQDGGMHYLGRMDTQVKIRGFRIEPGEVESCLLKIEGVKQAVVVARETGEGETVLCAYFVPQSDQLLTPEIIGSQLTSLPEYMIPTHFIQMDSIPLNASGKVNRLALPEPRTASSSVEVQPPRTDSQRLIAAIWAHILGLDEENIDINTSFFKLGGHSLKATLMLSRIKKQTGVQLPLAEVFKNPTIRHLALCLEGADPSGETMECANFMNHEYLYPSPAQQRLFVLQQLDSQSTVYNLFQVIRLAVAIDKERLNDVFHRLIRRHETLRSSFHLEGQFPKVRISHRVEFKVRHHDLSAEPVPGYDPQTDDYSSQVKRFVEDFIRPFDLSAPPLLRAMLVTISREHHLLITDMPHIICDGHSLSVLIRELGQLYSGETLEPLPLSYSQYLRRLADPSSQLALQRQQEFWVDQFKEPPPALQLPQDFPRPDVTGFAGELLHMNVPPALSRRVKALAARRNTTPFLSLLTAFTILMAKLSGQEDIVVGTPVSGRQDHDMQNLMGMLVNTLPLRNRPRAHKHFDAFLRETTSRTFDAMANRDYPFESLLERVDVDRDTGRNPLFDVMFAYQSFEGGHAAGQLLDVVNHKFRRFVSRFDLTFSLMDKDNGFVCGIEYSTHLFRRSTIERFFSFFCVILSTVVQTPDIELGDITLISLQEKRRILEEFNATTRPFPHQQTIGGVFLRQARLTPDNIAAGVGDHCCTYSCLRAGAERIARNLRDSGVANGSIVAIMAERSLHMIEGLLGILCAGAAYLPLDPRKPAARNRFILRDSAVRLLLTAPHLDVEVEDVAVKGLDIIEIPSQPPLESGVDNQPPQLDPQNPAYVIYTSGSTGVPKGVLIRHRSVINRLHWMQRQFPIDSGGRILQKTPYDFDVSVWELFWWSFAGASVHFLPPGQEKDPALIREAIVRYAITTIHFVPSMLSAFLEVMERDNQQARPLPLRRIFASGEALAPSQVKRFNQVFASKGTELINLYGPTEATVDVSWFICPSGLVADVIPIGAPIDNTILLVLDPQGNINPVGVPGELHIMGEGLAAGYLNRPELTAASFVPATDHGGGSMYKTGDLARYLPDGQIEFLGRIDFQVKVRGNRIELGEIEERLKDFPPVKDAVVTLRTGACGDEALAAYVVPRQEAAPALRRFLDLQTEGGSADWKRYQWDNGMVVFYLNRTETDFMYREIFVHHIYTKHGITLGEHAVVLDCGANIGVFSMFVDSVCPSASVYAFEPVPPVFDILRLNTALHNPNINIFNYGVSALETELEISYYPHATILSGAYGDKEQEIEAVKAHLLENMGDITPEQMEQLLDERLQSRRFRCGVKPLSTIIAQLGLDVIDLLKIDIEKSEKEALQGIAPSDWPKIQQVVMEVHDIDGRLEHIVDTLKSRGFTVAIDQDLENSHLFNLYAKRPGYGPRPAAPKTTGAGQWSLPEQLAEDLKRELARHLPGYMIPTFITPLSELPLTSSGKIDRKRLPEPLALSNRGYQPPETQLQQRLCAIWSEVLDIPAQQVGINHRFFDLGGHSLKATGVIAKIQRELEVSVPLIEMFKETTVKTLAAYVELHTGPADTIAGDRVVLLKKGNEGAPELFVFHDGGGAVEGYGMLASLLPEGIQCSGITASGLVDLEPVNASIEELAANYIRIIKEIQPIGPYLLAGWSMGGTIAFECARQLEQNGESPVFVGLIDAPGPKLAAAEPEPPFSLATERRTLEHFIPEDHIENLLLEAQNIDQVWRQTVSYVEGDMDLREIVTLLPPQIRPLIPEFEEVSTHIVFATFNLIRSLIYARSHYIPQTRLTTPVTYIGAKATGGEYEAAWSPYCHQPPRALYVEGDHYSLLRPPYLNRLSGQFNRLLLNAIDEREK
jgi:tyrocidine synthetase-3